MLHSKPLDKLRPFGPLAHVCLHLYYYIVCVYMWPSNLPYNYHITMLAKVVGKIILYMYKWMVSFLIIIISKVHFWLCEGNFYVACGSILSLVYCAFQKHANSEVQKPPSQLHFSLLSILITITSNEPWHKKTHTKWIGITNYKPWPFEPIEVNFCFLRGLLRLSMGAKITNFTCLLTSEFVCFWKAQ